MVSMLQSLFAIEQDFVGDPDRQRRGLLKLLGEDQGRAALLVARVDESVVGMASGQLVVSTSEGERSVWIEDVFVNERYRGAGIGRALLEGVLAWAVERGASRAQLLADRDNSAAIAFYRRFGLQSSNLIALRLPGLSGRQ